MLKIKAKVETKINTMCLDLNFSLHNLISKESRSFKN